MILHESLPIRGAWIEISGREAWNRTIRRRSPSGERGLKYRFRGANGRKRRSLPIRGAWIEISGREAWNRTIRRRSPSGERGLKSRTMAVSRKRDGRSPSGERGLKSRRARTPQRNQICRSLSGERGLKLDYRHQYIHEAGSLPIRGAWIEISAGKCSHERNPVAPHPGSVD